MKLNRTSSVTCHSRNKISEGIVIANTPLRRNDDGLVSLTDIFKASGECDANKEPAQWARYSGSQFIEFVSENLNMGKSHIYKTTRGKGGGTYAHWQIALAYAKYLSHDLHMQVNEAYMRFKMNDISMADEIADKATPEQQVWLEKRLQGKAARRQFTDTLKDHGVTGMGYGRCTHAIQSPIMGGSKADICKKRGLGRKVSLRDQMSVEELVATSMAELVASKTITQSGVRGNNPCAQKCRSAAEKVVNLLN